MLGRKGALWKSGFQGLEKSFGARLVDRPPEFYRRPMHDIMRIALNTAMLGFKKFEYVIAKSLEPLDGHGNDRMGF